MVEEKTELTESEPRLQSPIVKGPESEYEILIDENELKEVFSEPELRNGINDCITGLSKYAYINLNYLFENRRELFNKLIENLDLSVETLKEFIINESFQLRGETVDPIIKFYEPERILSDDIGTLAINFKENSLVFFDDAIVRVLGKPQTYYKKITFVCKYCQTEVETVQNFLSSINKPPFCPNPNCSNKRSWRKSIKGSFTGTYQEAFISTDLNKFLKCYLLDDDVGKLKAGDKAHIIGKLTTKFKNSGENSFSQIVISNNVEPVGVAELSQTISDKMRVFLIPDRGIFMDKLDKDGLQVECVVPFDEFNVKYRYFEHTGPVTQTRYIGYLKYKTSYFPFYDEDINGLSEMIIKNLGLTKRFERASLSVILQYVDSFPDQSDKISDIMGFSPQGWRLPQNSIIIVQDAHTLEVRNNLLKIDLGMDIQTNAEIFRKLYEATTLENKDIILAWVLAAPFFYVIKLRENIQPFLSINGEGQSGKTTFLETLILKGYGHIGTQKSSDTRSMSKVEGILASSTFPFFYDDLHDAKEEVVDLIKSYLTIEGRFQRKGAGKGKQFYSVDKPYVAPIAATSNTSVNWMGDKYLLQRVLHFNVKNRKKNPYWKHYRDSLPKGYLLAALYNETKDWTADKIYKVINRYKKEIDDDDDLSDMDIRLKDLYSIMLFGRYLALRLFGLELDLKLVPQLIQETRGMYDDIFSSLLLQQIIEGEYTDVYDKVIGASIPKFIKKGNWVKTPLYWANIKVGKDIIKCKCWRTQNISEIQNYIEGKTTKIWTHAEFKMKLEDIFPRVYTGVKRIRYYDEEGNEKVIRDRGVLVPEEDIDNIFRSNKKDNESEKNQLIIPDDLTKEFGVGEE